MRESGVTLTLISYYNVDGYAPLPKNFYVFKDASSQLSGATAGTVVMSSFNVEQVPWNYIMVRAKIDEDDDFYPVYSEYLYISMNFTAVNVIVTSINISGGAYETVSGNGILTNQIPLDTDVNITLFISDDKNTGLNT